MPLLQKGLQFAGPTTVGGPLGRAMTPLEGPASSIARIPPDSGVRSEAAPSLMAGKFEGKHRNPRVSGDSWAHSPLRTKRILLSLSNKGLHVRYVISRSTSKHEQTGASLSAVTASQRGKSQASVLVN